VIVKIRAVPPLLRQKADHYQARKTIPARMNEQNKKGDFMARRSQLNSQKKRRLLRPALKLKQGEMVHCGYGIT